MWAAGKEHLIVAYFCGNSRYFCHVRNLSIPPPPRSNFHKTSAHCVASDLATRRVVLGGRRSGGGHTPVVVKFPLFSTKVKIYAYLPPSLEFLLQKSAPGIASDVATRRVALERAPEGRRRQQRRWRTTSMVSDLVSQKK